MNRSQLAQVLHAASRIVTDGDILVIGSQSILGTFSEDQLPDAAVASIEVDIAFFDDPSYEKADLVDAVLGEMSPFHEDHGFYGQGVEITTATLPPGWEGRVVQRQIGGVPRPVSFLERHDLVISKLIAGREKDLAFASALLRANLVDAETLAARMLSMVETIAPAALAVNRWPASDTGSMQRTSLDTRHRLQATEATEDSAVLLTVAKLA